MTPSDRQAPMPDSRSASGEAWLSQGSFAAAMESFDVPERPNSRNLAKMFQAVAIQSDISCTRLSLQHTETKEELVRALEQKQSLQARLNTRRRLQLFVGSLSILGGILIGFGVNALSTDKPDHGSGLPMILLGAGALLQLAPLVSTWVDGASPDSSSKPARRGGH